MRLRERGGASMPARLAHAQPMAEGAIELASTVSRGSHFDKLRAVLTISDSIDSGEIEHFSAASILTGALDDPERSVRRNAVMVLAKHGMVVGLCKGLRSNDQQVRGLSAEMVFQLSKKDLGIDNESVSSIIRDLLYALPDQLDAVKMRISSTLHGIAGWRPEMVLEELRAFFEDGASGAMTELELAQRLRVIDRIASREMPVG